MSNKRLKVPPGQEAFRFAELVMHLPANWQISRELSENNAQWLWPVQWLRKLANFPHLERTWLGGPHTMVASDDPPVPLGPGVEQTCLLLIADFADWSPLALADGTSIKFYTVIPIYTEERDFEVQHGVFPLLERFHERDLSTIFDPHRPNVARD